MTAERTIRDRTAIVGVGSTPYYKRGRSAPQTLDEMVGKAILAALDDAGLAPKDVDGFAYFAGGFDTPMLTEMLGIPEVRFTATLTGTGGGSAGAVGLAAAAIVSGQADCVVVVGGNQMSALRFGAITASYPATPENAFFGTSGLVGPGHMFALLARRHMALYGTTREHFAEVALAIRANAVTNPEAVMYGKPLTLDDYFAAPMIADPHGLYDFCLETDAAVAVIVTSAERARDLRQKPVPVLACAHGGARDWGRSIYWMNMPDEVFASSGHAIVAKRLYEQAGVGPSEVDGVQIYDHFSSQVILQLEDYGFCERGEGGPFVASGAIRRDGALPVNTDGGQLSCGYAWGMTQIREAVEQLRGTAINQLADPQIMLVTGGPSVLPVSGLLLRSA